ncbi:hypothetical protein CR203_15965 [Salipaludibacillus neizhouensis]|uniref:PepSY domain-containing protein n=2 Tax=Salipaludibacillus neizhouensis TaxID=885475 RepID=A0A3A9KFK3_9BACI|nr:PepSY domain-containing protein [Salipaludibacillus neizhouensis]RKL66385.1 hypothetical protein CR203_15965 [Salipaludibacillus neizhouensis]
MMRNKSLFFLLFGILLLIGIGYFTYSALTSEEMMSEADIKTMLEGRYNGSVLSLEVNEESTGLSYDAELHSAQGAYLIEVDAHKGEVLSLEKISAETEFQEKQVDVELTKEEITEIVEARLTDEAEILDIQLNEGGSGSMFYSVAVNHSGNRGTFEIDATSKEVLTYTEDQVEQLTQQQASEIALNEHSGVIDDITLEQQDGRLVYEIEVESDETGVDADIIIDAYSGEVISVVLDN